MNAPEIDSGTHAAPDATQAPTAPVATPRAPVKANPHAVANRRHEALTKTEKAMAILRAAMYRGLPPSPYRKNARGFVSKG